MGGNGRRVQVQCVKSNTKSKRVRAYWRRYTPPPSVHEVFHMSGVGDYNGPVQRIAPGRLTVRYAYSCGDPSFAFLSFTWNGNPYWDYANIHVDGAAATGTQYLHPDETSGYFEVASQSDCSWTVIATQVW